MKRILLLSICVLAACGRPEAAVSSEAKSPMEKAPQIGDAAPRPAAATEKAPQIDNAAPRPSAVAPASAPEKKPAAASADTSASEAYHTPALAGRAAFPPGTGALVEVPERDKKAMLAAAMSFFDAARTENADAMRDVSTQLFTTNLIDNMDRYRDRFYRGLTDSLVSALKGAVAGEVRMPGEGHFEIELKFGDDTSRRLMMAVESGHWRVNRL